MEPNQKSPNQETEIQENPPLIDGSVNFEVPNSCILAMDNVDLDENVSIDQIFSFVV